MRGLIEDKKVRTDSVVVIDVMIPDLMLARDIFYRASNGFRGIHVIFSATSTLGHFFFATNIPGFMLAFESRQPAHVLPILDVRLLAHDFFPGVVPTNISLAHASDSAQEFILDSVLLGKPCRLGHYRGEVLKNEILGLPRAV
jgi:hypothetical protein